MTSASRSLPPPQHGVTPQNPSPTAGYPGSCQTCSPTLRPGGTNPGQGSRPEPSLLFLSSAGFLVPVATLKRLPFNLSWRTVLYVNGLA